MSERSIRYYYDCVFLKEKKSSVLLIHEDTPKETAIEMAKRANCVGILYGEYGDCTKLEVGNFTRRAFFTAI